MAYLSGIGVTAQTVNLFTFHQASDMLYENEGQTHERLKDAEQMLVNTMNLAIL